jgi:hypothetical protein
MQDRLRRRRHTKHLTSLMGFFKQDRLRREKAHKMTGIIGSLTGYSYSYSYSYSKPIFRKVRIFLSFNFQAGESIRVDRLR